MSTVTMPSPRVSSMAHALAPASVSTLTLPSRWPAGARDVDSDASDAVAAHLRDRAVGVDDAHADVAVRLSGGQDEENAVGADAEPAIAKGDGALGRDDCLVLRVDDDEVVAQPLVLEKLHGKTPRNRPRG